MLQEIRLLVGQHKQMTNAESLACIDGKEARQNVLVSMCYDCANTRQKSTLRVLK